MEEELRKTCILDKRLKVEHQKARAELTNQFVMCPLFQDKQLCLWCCFHITDQAHPQKRQFAMSTYDLIASELLKKTWDEVWNVCGMCRNNINR